MYDLCVDGDLHEIKLEYREYVCGKKLLFRSYMLNKAMLNEIDIRPETFVILPPVACPATVILSFQNQCQSQKKMWKNLRQNLTIDVIEPFKGETDSRTAIEFLYSFENHIDRRIETKTDSKYRFHDLTEQVLLYTLHEVACLEYEDLRGSFVTKYWSVENQLKVFSEFLKSCFPMYYGQQVSKYVYYWVNRLKRNTMCIILCQDFVEKLINRVTIRYGFHLTRHNRGAEWSEVCSTVESCESEMMNINKYRKQNGMDVVECMDSVKL